MHKTYYSTKIMNMAFCRFRSVRKRCPYMLTATNTQVSFQFQLILPASICGLLLLRLRIFNTVQPMLRILIFKSENSHILHI